MCAHVVRLASAASTTAAEKRLTAVASGTVAPAIVNCRDGCHTDNRGGRLPFRPTAVAHDATTATQRQALLHFWVGASTHW